MDITPLTNAVNDAAAQGGDTVQDILGGGDQAAPTLPPPPPAPAVGDMPDASAVPVINPADLGTVTPAPEAPELPPVQAPEAVVEPAPASALPTEQTLEELEKAVADSSSDAAELPELPPAQVPGEPAPGSVPADAIVPDAAINIPEVADVDAAVSTIGDAATSGNSELDAIKDAALKELAPIVDKLDQPPEEKFNTMVMLLQASDDKTLVKPAFEAAKGIEDEAKKAQALLDVVNEVNYLERKTS